jgi:oligoribonuclease
MADPKGIDRLIWVDIETMGLDPAVCPIIEVGFRLTDIELKTLDERQLLIWDSPYFDDAWSKASVPVKEMHNTSGLAHEAQNMGIPIDAAREVMVDFLSMNGVDQEVLCGSSVDFDRSFLLEQYPEVAAMFHYRVIDISTLKELCRRLNPRVYEHLEESTKPKKAHRVIDDLNDTIEEFRFYRDEFLYW